MVDYKLFRNPEDNLYQVSEDDKLTAKQRMNKR